MNGERICEVCGIEIEELAWQHTPLPEGASAFEVLVFPVAACGPYSIALTPNASTESEAWTVSFLRMVSENFENLKSLRPNPSRPTRRQMPLLRYQTVTLLSRHPVRPQRRW